MASEWASDGPARLVLTNAVATPARAMPSQIAIYSGRLAIIRQTASPLPRPRAPAPSARSGWRAYTVFNVAQCDGLPASDVTETRSEFERLEDTDDFLFAVGATVPHGGDQAFYSPSTDAITLPPFEQFETPEHHYGTSLHEHGHWTGAKHRLAREFGKRFGDDAYAFEELIAELTSAFLCAELEIGGNLRHPEYLSHWVRILRSDTKAILSAGARASEAADYLARLAGRRVTDVDESAEDAA